MLQLPNGCSCSKPSIFPKNWMTGGTALLQKDWRIQYYFQDPAYRHKYRYGKLVFVKGMNRFKTLPERRDATRRLLANELQLLQLDGYNPITKVALDIEPEINYEIDPTTPLIQALRSASEKLSVSNRVNIGIKSVIKGLEKAAGQLRYEEIEICKITRRHIKAMLDQCSRNSSRWSNTRYNLYRGYLMMLYKELVELEAVPGNPLWDIAKKPVTQRLKPTLNNDQRTTIDKHLASVFPEFRNFIHLFFHSGGRKPELLQLKPPMVDLVNQKYKCIIKKRKNYTEVERTIKSIALPYWKFFLAGCPDDHFIFGTRFKPGTSPMAEDMPTKYWRLHVKETLKIPIDFYSLKHLNTAEVVDALDEAAAAKLNAHTTTAMVVNIYDIRQKDRQHDRLKEVANEFV